MTSNRLERLLLPVILAVALILRFRHLLAVQFNPDNAYPIWQAINTLDRGLFPVIGQSTSVQIPSGALTGYIFLPFVALTRSPVGPLLLVVGLNWLAIWCAHRAVRSLLGIGPALLAAGLMAVNPWVIYYSRLTWTNAFFVFAPCAAAWLLWPALVGGCRHPARRTLLALLLVTALAMTHVYGYALVIPTGLLVTLYRHRLPMRAVWAGALVFALVTCVYGVGLLAQLDEIRSDRAHYNAPDLRFSLAAWPSAARLVTGQDFSERQAYLWPETAAHFALNGALLLGSGVALWHIRKGRRTAAAILLCWFFAPVVAVSVSGLPAHSYYQLLGLPAGYGLAAWGLSIALRPHTRAAAWTAAVMGIAFALLMTARLSRHYREFAAPPAGPRLYAPPLSLGLPLAHRLGVLVPEDGLIVGETHPWVMTGLLGYRVNVMADARTGEASAAQFSVIPEAGGVLLSLSDGFPPGAAIAAEITLPQGGELTISVLPPAADYPFPEAMTPGQTPSQQGLTLVGCMVQPAGGAEAWQATSFWRVDFVAADVPQRLFTPFIEVAQASGEDAAMFYGAVVSGNIWRPGDLHVHRIRFTAPGPDFRLRVGQVDVINSAYVIFTPAGAPMTTSAACTGPLS